MKAALLILALAAPASALASPRPLPNAVRALGACVERSVAQGGAPGFGMGVFGQVFSRLDRRFVEGDDFLEFALTRAELGTCATYHGIGGFVLNVEAVRSAGPESLLGINGDSLILRAKHAFGFSRMTLGPGELTAQFGLVPDPWTQTLEGRYDLRGVAPTLSERAFFFDTSDLGATLEYTVLDGRLGLRFAYLNGEGRNQIEQNSGKNLNIVLSGRPLELDLAGPLQVDLHFGYRDGSLGTGRSRNHRLFGAMTVLHPRVKGGLEWSEAFGYLGRGEVNARLVGAWASGTILDPFLGLYARFDHLNQATGVSGATANRFEIGLYSDALGQTDPSTPFRMRAYLGYANESFGDSAGPLPGVPTAADGHTITIGIEALGFSAPLHFTPSASKETEDDPVD
jgi:hypothetical protein